ncbi:Protein NRT1/ PTR FAMILY 6.4 [Vigna angularis]|uniref:Protein NRT1/ PTR FAMILY 6.4 n=1 Tax=Phaseolus angularis TaxID=3914 RepID=A0A8T0JSR8_PHAAN|nr:Protein NRT1/ PTR FAMILY 6.4 [Vigna angularis]
MGYVANPMWSPSSLENTFSLSFVSRCLCHHYCIKQVLVASHEEEEKETEVIAAVDFRGHPVLNRPRICVMGIAMNLVTYLVRDLNLPSPDFATIVTNVMGTVNLLGLVGGFLSDAKLGRYLTVAISTTIAAMGVSLLSAATTIPSMRPPTCSGVRKQHHECIQATGKQLALLYIALNTIPVGGGGIKSNVSEVNPRKVVTDLEELGMLLHYGRSGVLS